MSNGFNQPVGLRLRFNGCYIIVTPPDDDGDNYLITITDAVGEPVANGDRVRALKYLLRKISDIRKCANEALV